MRTTDKSTDKTNSYTRMGIIMLAAAATGAILGFLFLFILDVDNIKTGISGALTLAQQLMLPLLIIITAVSVVCGEASIHKLRAIGKKILETEDEECDRWDYEEEKTGAQGTAANILSQVMCVLVLAAGYSLEYIADDHSGNLLASCCVFLLCYIYDAFWSVRFVKTVQNAHPEKKGDPSSKNFQQQWLASCDEAEKEIIYQSAYRSYSQTNRWIPALLVFAMLGHLLFSTGILAIFMVAVIWLITAVSYLRSCVNLKKAKLRD